MAFINNTFTISVVFGILQGACTPRGDNAALPKAHDSGMCTPQVASQPSRVHSQWQRLVATRKVRAPPVAKPGLEQIFVPESTLLGTEFEFPLAPTPAHGLDDRGIRSRFAEVATQKCQLCYECKLQGVDPYIPGIQIKKAGVDKSLVINFQIDPGVIEVTTSPMTYQENVIWMPELEGIVFATARQLEDEGLLVNSDLEPNRWSGHINVSWPGFNFAPNPSDRNSTELAHRSIGLLLNFFIDYANHPELALGVLGGDIRNAPPWILGDAKDRDGLYRARVDFKNGLFQNTHFMAEALKATSPMTFPGRFGCPRTGLPVTSPAHQGCSRYTAINVDPLLNLERKWNYSRRIEMRAFFAPRSTEEMLANYTIVLARLMMLFDKYESQPLGTEEITQSFKPIFSPPASLENHPPRGLLGGLTPPLAARSYISYLKGAGLDPTVFASFLRDTQVKQAVLNQSRTKCSH